MVAFRSAKVAELLRNFRGAKGDHRSLRNFRGAKGDHGIQDLGTKGPSVERLTLAALVDESSDLPFLSW